MTKKNRKAKNNKQAEIEIAEIKAESTETAPVESETAGSPPEVQQAHVEHSGSDEISADDLLDDVRRALIEEEAQSDEKKPAWWNRSTKSKKKDQADEIEMADTSAEIPRGVEPGIGVHAEQGEYLEEIDELIDLLDTEVDATEVKPVMETVVAPAEPEVPVDVEELKKRVFSPGGPGEEREPSEVRSIALEGGGDVFVEVEAKAEDPLDERLKALENSLRPYRRSIYFALAFLGVVLAVLASALMFRVYQNSRPPEPTELPSNLPFPRTMILPGGLSFTLGKGAIVDGAWNPRGPEWLKGTEICRWVAIPWSRQLEAVVRTLTQKDTIELVMSNNDKLKYNVYSIKELTLEEMQALDSNSPCLLLVLAEQDSDKRWVVTALP